MREHKQAGSNQGEANGQHKHGTCQNEGCRKRGRLLVGVHD